MKRLLIVAGMMTLASSASFGQLRIEYDTVVSKVVDNEIVTHSGKKTSVVPGTGMHYGKGDQAGPGFMMDMAAKIAEAQGGPWSQPAGALSGTRAYAGIAGCTGRKATDVPYDMEGVPGPDATVEVWTCTEPETGRTFIGEMIITWPNLTTYRLVATEVKVLRPQ